MKKILSPVAQTSSTIGHTEIIVLTDQGRSAKEASLTIGTMVTYRCPSQRGTAMGHVTDMLQDNDRYWMFEVIALEPYDRGWYSAHALEVLNESN